MTVRRDDSPWGSAGTVKRAAAAPKVAKADTPAAEEEQKTAGTAVAEQKEAGLPATYDYGDYTGSGFEGTTRDDYAAPFLYLLQSLSPQVVKGQEGARPGAFVNTVNGEIYPADESKGEPGVVFIPCYREHLYVEWRPRNAGGGFVGNYAVDSAEVRNCRETQKFGEFTVNGNDLVETFYVFGILLTSDGGQEPAVIAFNSTKIKVYKQWMTRANSITLPGPGGRRIKPPLFAHRWRIRSIMQQNSEGVFHNFRITFDGPDAEAARLDPNGPPFRAAAELYEAAKSGMMRANTESLNREEPGATETPF